MPKKKIILLSVAILIIVVAAVLYFYRTQQSSILNTTQDEILETPLAEADIQLGEILNAAQESDTLSLKNCQPNPAVLSIDRGDVLTINNEDSSVARTIELDQRTHQIPASGSIEIIADSPRGAGVYAYVCDDSEKISGYIVVENKEQ